MGDETMSREVFEHVATEVKERGGSTTSVGEQRHAETGTLDPLVDPKEHGLIRRSITRMEKKGKRYVATVGLAMAVETLFDTTGSMGGNVDLAFKALPDLYDLLADPKSGVLRRYDTQVATAIFGDRGDAVTLCRSQFEMAQKIAEQMTLMVPLRDGGDGPEDPHYGIFGAAYLTWSAARHFGLGSYHFTMSDAPGRERTEMRILEKVFGDTVIETAAENGFKINPKALPTTQKMVQDLAVSAHPFFLQVENHGSTTEFWTEVYGKDRMVVLPETELVHCVQAAIIGLTEGVLSLQNLEQFLKDSANLSAADARRVARAVAGIPIGAQTRRPNFKKVFKKGAEFAKKGDVFPLGFDGAPVPKGDGEEGKPSRWL
jgi:hypothetical protein